MSIDPRVDVLTELRKQTALLERIAAALTKDAAPDVPASLLAGPHGDPLVNAKDPRDWTGEPMKGKHFSECPPDYLDLLADRFDYFASKEVDGKKQHYQELDAKRARGWAQRLRSGWTPVVPIPPVPESGEPTW